MLFGQNEKMVFDKCLTVLLDNRTNYFLSELQIVSLFAVRSTCIVGHLFLFYFYNILADLPVVDRVKCKD